MAHAVSTGLADFAKQTTKDEGAVRREQRFLDRRGQKFGQGLLLGDLSCIHLMHNF